jgi:hypothetical protein
MKGNNININNLKMKVKMQHFLFGTFKKNYIMIWSCMLLENVMEVLHLLMPKKFVDQFLFIFGHEQCTGTSGQLTYYYLKDLNCVYSAC